MAVKRLSVRSQPRDSAGWGGGAGGREGGRDEGREEEGRRRAQAVGGDQGRNNYRE